ncbi:MAG: peptidylprolyl isomerase [Eubacteriales bacterium]|nr:peptidylprolyl isomerase [Eubacteriales bacterium]
MNIRKGIKRIMVFLLSCILVCSLSACKGIELENKTEAIEEYTKSQAMILIANEINKYQNAYSKNLWKVEINEKGETLDRLIVQNVQEFMSEIKLLNILAKEKGVELTSLERDDVRQMTEEYLGMMSDADREYIGCSADDVTKVYTDYYIATKMARLLVGANEVDISDSEVRVMKIMIIGTADIKKAKAILKKIKIDNQSFNSMASRYTELEQIEMSLARGTNNDLIEKVAFTLEEGQVSNILSQGDMYYIIKCVDDYDEAAVKSRKEGIITALNSKEYKAVMEPYRELHKIAFREKFWNEQQLRRTSGSTIDSFFDIFKKHAGD